MNEKQFSEYLMSMNFDRLDRLEIIHELKAYGKILINDELWTLEQGLYISNTLLSEFERMLDDNDNVLKFE